MLVSRRSGLPGDDVGCKAHEEGPYEGADFLGGALTPPLLFLETAFPHTARERGGDGDSRVDLPRSQ